MIASSFSPSSHARLFAGAVLSALLAIPVSVLAAPPAQAVVQRLIGARAAVRDDDGAARRWRGLVSHRCRWRHGAHCRLLAGGIGARRLRVSRPGRCGVDELGRRPRGTAGAMACLQQRPGAHAVCASRLSQHLHLRLHHAVLGLAALAAQIDWMALHGIDMPLAMEGQEAIWQTLWREFDVGDAALAEYFSGPAFTPWQRMGNIEGYRAPLPQQWIDSKRVLQTQILTRMRELGMQPVLPAFAGYVPKAFAQAHPNARIYRMRAWEGFTKPIGWIRAIPCSPKSRADSLSCTRKPTALASSIWPMPSTKCCRQWPTTAATWPPPSTATASPTPTPHVPRQCRQRNAMHAWPSTVRRCIAPSPRSIRRPPG